MIEYQIKEVYDGRLPEYQVVEVNSQNNFECIVLKTFDDIEQAEKYIKSLTD